ncbi:MAG: hypothetical protein ACOYVD_10715 [Bacillota bacterium]
MDDIQVFYGEGRYRILLKSFFTLDGLIVTAVGGEKPHVGAAVMAVPGLEHTLEISVPHHKDAIAFKPMAEYLCKNLGEKVVVTGGIHIANASKEEIEILLNNCLGATEALASQIALIRNT